VSDTATRKGQEAHLQILLKALEVQPNRLLVKITIPADIQARVTEDGGMITP
jgi:hypothetical protein